MVLVDFLVDFPIVVICPEIVVFFRAFGQLGHNPHTLLASCGSTFGQLLLPLVSVYQVWLLTQHFSAYFSLINFTDNGVYNQLKSQHPPIKMVLCKVK